MSKESHFSFDNVGKELASSLKFIQSGARQGGGRGQGGRLTTLNFRTGAVTTLNLFHVLIFYEVIFPVNKQGSIASPPTTSIIPVRYGAVNK